MVVLNLTAKKVLATVLVAVGIGAASFSAYRWSLDAGTEALRSEAAVNSDIYHAALFAPTDKYSYLPEVVSSHPVVRDALLYSGNAKRLDRANRFLHHLRARSESDLIYIINDKGVVVASSNWQAQDTLVGNNYAFRPYFQDALTNGSGRFYGVGVTTMRPGYYLSYVIKHDGAVLGVAVVKVDLSDLDREWNKSKDEFNVTDKNGVIFLSTRPEWKYRLSKPLSADAQDMVARTRQYGDALQEPLPVEIINVLGKNESVVAIADVSGNKFGTEKTVYFWTSGALDESDWTLHTLVPMEGVYARAVRVAIITGGSLLLLIQSLLYFWQMRARGIERRKATDELEEKHRVLLKLSNELRTASITDPLTGAYNRRFFMESITNLASAARRHNTALSIIVIDADHFKQVNDVHGHPAGDKVLQRISAIANETLREEDVFARLGGEEFIAALPNTDAATAQVVAERLRKVIMTYPIEVDGAIIRITVSIGISQHRNDEPVIDKAIKRADEALYAAKKQGRNQVVVCQAKGESVRPYKSE